MNSKVSEKGQVTIPKPLRDRLGIKPGEVLDFKEDRGRLVATKVATHKVVDEVFGLLDLGKSTDEVIADLRGESV